MRRATLLAGAILMAGASAHAETWRVEPARTEIAFEVGAKGYPVTHGVFRNFASTLSIDFDRPQRSMVNFTVTAASLDTQTPVLDAYVTSPAFLNATQFPDIRFVSTAVRKLDEQSVEVTGNLTLLGVTHPETFTVQVARDAASAVTLHAEGQVRRSAYGMTAGLPLISDDVRIIVATRAEAH